jgi:septin family protein
MNSTEWFIDFYFISFFKFCLFFCSWKPILDFVDQQFLKYFQAETSFGIERKYVQDQRVHCCLYFLPPSIRG